MMSEREQRRAQVLTRVLSGAWTPAQAAATLGRSERQVRRLLRAYEERGPAALVHGNRGRRPVHALPAAVRDRWLGAEGPEWTLIAGIDDATGTIPWALFRAQEDAAGYMAWLRRVVETRGVPVALYVDRHGIFQRRRHEAWRLEEELAGRPLPTQMGRVLEELGIRLIHALSPQAKGRVERLFGTLQDRLVAELRLAGLHTGSRMDEANRVLCTYLPRFNARFAVPAAETTSAYRSPGEVLPTGVTLDQICCFKYTRVVGLDNTVRFQEHRLQLGPGPHRRSYAKARVEVHERLDGSVAVYHEGQLLATTPAPAEAPVLRARNLPRPSSSRAAPTGPPGPPESPESLSPSRATPVRPEWRAGDPQPATHPWKRTRVVDLPIRRRLPPSGPRGAPPPSA